MNKDFKFEFKYGDKVKINIDFEDAVNSEIDCQYDPEDVRYIPGDLAIIWESLINNKVFTIDRCDMNKPHYTEVFVYEYYYLKELPNIRFSKWELKREE